MSALLAIGAATALASAITGAVSSANENRKARGLIDSQKAANDKWYNDRMNSDYMKRSDVQSVLSKQKELFEQQYKRSRATNNVAGGTAESLAAQQSQANNTVADTMTNIAGQATTYKENVEQQHRSVDSALTQQQVATHSAQAAQIANAASQGIAAGVNMMSGGIGGSIDKSSLGGKEVSPEQAQVNADNFNANIPRPTPILGVDELPKTKVKA